MNHEKHILEILRANNAGAALIKEYLSDNIALLRGGDMGKFNGVETCGKYTSLVDSLLRALFGHMTAELGYRGSTALVALGGYGRGELNFQSDIDLMLLYKQNISKELEDLTQKILYVLWDTGLDLGFSIRSIGDTIALSKGDLKTQTALLDMRFIMGDEALYAELSASVKKKLFSKAASVKFATDKIEETRLRHARFGGSVYILEPNVKEGEGGLRDYHTAHWVVKARTARAAHGLLTPDLISEEDLTSLKTSIDFITWVRNELHFETARKSDQLTFDQQERIAALLGFENSDNMLAVEAFMQLYYRQATNVNRLSEIIISRCMHRREERLFAWPRKKVRIDRNYNVVDGVLTARSADIFQNAPEAVISAFEYQQSLGVEIDQPTRDMILDFVVHSDGSYRDIPEVSSTFIKILRGKNVFKTLSDMHRLKFLEGYIPEFSDISCRVQHDMYHIYTVDAHTLFAVREIERLGDAYKDEFPLLASLFSELQNPEILYLAVLFHDIGKSAGKGHAEKGAEMAPKICERMNLPEDGRSLVRFLVKHHLILANTAQYRDMHDERLVIEFAKTVGDAERLNMLYLLTFADVRAVGPDVWSPWKGALFQELYFKALTVLERGTFEVEDADVKIERIKTKVAVMLDGESIDAQAVDDYFALLPHRYFLSNSAEFIAEHIRIFRDLGNRAFTVRFRQDAERKYTEIIVCTHDVPALFSRITGVMAANAVNILGAQINTMKNGVAIDVLQVNSAVGELITDQSKFRKIEGDLSDVLTGKVRVDALVGKRRPSILDMKARPKVRTSVQVDNDVSEAYTVIDIHTQNRIGLLYDITSTLSRLGLYIYIAKIATKGEEAADIFYIKDIFSQKIFYKEKLREIADAIYGVVESKDSGDAAGQG